MTVVALPLRGVPTLRPSRQALHVTERNARVYLRLWYMFASGFLEPFFYLLSIGIGVGKLVGGIEVGAHTIAYGSYVAPGMMAAAAMNGAVFDSTFSIFFKLKYMKLYDALVATPLTTREIAVGEIMWSLFRCEAYATSFLAVMALLGYTESWWAVMALPSALLIGFSFSAMGIALTSFMRGWRDFDFINLAMIPLFLFSSTFYPLGVYPRALELAVQVSPLFHGVSLVRGFTLGDVGVGMVGHAAYLLALGVVGAVIAGRRLERLLLT